MENEGVSFSNTDSADEHFNVNHPLSTIVNSNVQLNEFSTNYFFRNTSADEYFLYHLLKEKH